MNDNVVSRLVAKFPELLGGRISIDVPDGWERIVTDLCSKIEDHVKSGGEPVRVLQIKEKFAGLRFYYGGGDERVAELISDAEDLAEKTCQISGEPGRYRTLGGLMITLSDSEFEKANEKVKQR